MIRMIQFIIAISITQITTTLAQNVKTPIGKIIATSEIESYLEQKMKANGTPGLSMAIINDGKVAFHMVKGFSRPEEKITKETVFEGASLSKPLFSYFVMTFVEQGLLELDKPLYQYLPYKDIAHDNRYKKITARIVLSHRTGFPNWRTDTKGDELFLDFEPGTQFQYSGEGYQYLALVLQKLLNTDAKGLQKQFEEKVSIPLGLDVSRYIPNNKNQKNKAQAFKNGKWLPVRDQGNSIFGAAYGINSEAKDFAKWMIALMNKKGLNESSYKELFKNQTQLPEDNPNRATGITHLTLGFYTGAFPFGTVYGHGGNNDNMFTSMFFFEPESKWGAVLFTNSSFGERMGVEFFQYIMQSGK